MLAGRSVRRRRCFGSMHFRASLRPRARARCATLPFGAALRRGLRRPLALGGRACPGRHWQAGNGRASPELRRQLSERPVAAPREREALKTPLRRGLRLCRAAVDCRRRTLPPTGPCTPSDRPREAVARTYVRPNCARMAEGATGDVAAFGLSGPRTLILQEKCARADQEAT